MSLLVIGECMLELSQSANKQLSHSFAGDTYNTGVYAKRCMPDLNVCFATAVGDDMFSHQALNEWKTHGLECQHVAVTEGETIGIYAISTDERGERSFAYWRKGSAASKMMDSIDLKSITSKPWHMVYVSGITLAILSEKHRQQLHDLLLTLQYNGSQVVFDPNYRPKLWQSADEAKFWIEKLYSISDILLPGLEDHQVLFRQPNVNAMIKYFQQFKTSEMIIKCGKGGMFAFKDGEPHCDLAFTPAPIQIDSTAAGDSFAGGYLSGRLHGLSIEEALKQADKVARTVVQHRGAIIDPSVSLS